MGESGKDEMDSPTMFLQVTPLHGTHSVTNTTSTHDKRNVIHEGQKSLMLDVVVTSGCGWCGTTSDVRCSCQHKKWIDNTSEYEVILLLLNALPVVDDDLQQVEEKRNLVCDLNRV